MPTCPFCKHKYKQRDLEKLLEGRRSYLKNDAGKFVSITDQTVYCCVKCDAILGFSDRKNF